MARLSQRQFLFFVLASSLLAACGCRPSDRKEREADTKRPSTRIVLDPGHGGKDIGASAKSGQTEKELVLHIALQVEQLLREKSISVVLTRTTDRYVSLQRRAEIANDDNATLLVSIHANSCANEDAHGFELFYVEDEVANESLRAARLIQRHMGRATGAKDRGIKKQNYAVLSRTKCPSVLVEVGYLSSKSEAEHLSDPSYRKKVARGIARGIVSYVRSQPSAMLRDSLPNQGNGVAAAKRQPPPYLLAFKCPRRSLPQGTFVFASAHRRESEGRNRV